MEATSTKIVVVTRVFSKVDTVTFESSEEEMEPLLEVVRMWLEAESKFTVQDLHKRLVERFGNGDGKIRPCFAAWGAGLVKGEVIMEALSKRSGD